MIREASPRIGSVPYQNARPLLEGLEFPITELVPAKLFDGFQEGMFDAAILSSIDVIAMPDAEVVDQVAIGSKGEVHSVILAYKGELEELRAIQLDPSSHTSNALLQIILDEFHSLQPEYVQITERKSLDLPLLLIGDPAIAFRKQTSDPEVRYLDLGEEWYRQTGLPFIFALWALKSDFTEKKSLSSALREAKERGLANLPLLASKEADPEFSLRYLRDWICYDLGEEEKRGLQLYGDLLRKKKLIPPDIGALNFV
jgi:predicted solute-binding protein